MAKINSLIVLIGLFSSSRLFAQDRYMVFFADKDNVVYTLDNPEAYLSERSINRREKMDISITEADLPVDTAYVHAVRDQGAEVYFTTRWMNGVLTEMTEETAALVEALSFVDSVVYVANGTKLTHSPGTYSVAETFTEPTSVTATTVVQNAMLGVDVLHEDGYTGEGILIAVFDDGFKGVNQFEPFEHLFAEDQLVATIDFVKNSGNVFQYDDHGTSTLSCIAQYYGEDYTGTAPDASFILCVTEDISSEYRVEEYNWLFAAEFADSIGADVISASLGYNTFSDNSMNYTYADLDGTTTVCARAAEMASARGMVPVVSAGNEGNGSWKYITTPADAAGVLAIASVTSQGTVSGFSSIGPSADGRIKPDLAAMGSSATIFYLSGSSGYIGTGSGTSFSCPQIAGLVAGLLQAHPDWTYGDLIMEIKAMGSQADDPDNSLGYGIPVYVSELVEDVVLEEELKVYPNPVEKNVVNIDFGDLQITSALEITVFDEKGRRIFIQNLTSQEVEQQMEIVIKHFSKGLYFLTFHSKELNKTVKLIKI